MSKSPERMSSLGPRGSELRTRSEPILRGEVDIFKLRGRFRAIFFLFRKGFKKP